MFVIDYLKPEGVFLNLKAIKKKEKLFEALIYKAVDAGLIKPDIKEDIIKELIERERQATTGIGEGIAIPHCKMDGLDKACVLAATIPEGIKYASMDGRPVRLVFCFLFPSDQGTQYLQVLAKLSRILKDENLRNKLILAQDAESFRSIVAEADVVPLAKEGKKGNYAFILCVNEEGSDEAVLSSLVEIGAQTAVIIESETLQKKLLYDIPIFAGVKFFHSKTPFSKTYVGTLSSLEEADSLAKLLKGQGIDITKPGGGFLLAFEAGRLIGGVPEDLDI